MTSKNIYGDSIVTPEGIVSFPKVFEPEQQDGDKEPKYSCLILVDKENPELKALQVACAKVAKEAHGKSLKELKSHPFKDGDQKDTEKYPEYKGRYVIRATTGRRPSVVRPDLSLIGEVDDEFYPGCIARMQVQPGSYNFRGEGVALYLQAIQKVGDGERLGTGEGGSKKLLFSASTAETDFEDDDDIPF